MSDTTKDAAAPAAGKATKKKGKLGKILAIGGGLVVLVGGGVGAGLYAASSGLVGGSATAAAGDANTPRLVPKAEEKRASAATAEGSKDDAAAVETGGLPTPRGEGGDKYASNYFTMEKEFTSNLKESVHFIQVGIAVSTPYDDRVIDNIKTHEIAVRSAILMTLGDTDEESVFTNDGKEALQKKLVRAINATLKQKEGFGGIGNVYFTNFVVQ